MDMENLFLLEFLVDSIDLKSKCDCDTPPGDTCVSFQFLDNEPLNVCESEFLPNKKQAGDHDLKSGKSCLFSLDPQQIDDACKNFDVTVSVYKKMQPGWLPEKITLGSSLISINNLFAQLINCVQIQENQAPVAKTLKDTFKLLDLKNAVVGTVSIYVRISCFGKLIVTQFQMNLDDKSVLFKDMGGQSLYRYKKSKQDESNGQSVDYNTQCPTVPCFPNDYQQQMIASSNMSYTQQPLNFANMYAPIQDHHAGQPSPSNEYNNKLYGQLQQQPLCIPPDQYKIPMQSPYASQALPCNKCDNNLYGQQQQLQQQPPCFHPDRFNAQMLTPCEECGTLLMPQNIRPSLPCALEYPPNFPPEVQDLSGNYQEIGASMGGNALTIRVHKDKNKIEQINGAGSINSCVCKPENTKIDTVPRHVESYPVSATRVSGSDRTFDIQRGVQQRNQKLPFTVKMLSQGEPLSNSVILNPPVALKPDGTQYTEISDSNKEKFILRIGKKSEGAHKKANLELELCTPRGPDLKPTPKKETRDSQYDSADCKNDDVKTKDKKVKAGKKKKEKKGKRHK